MSSMNHEQLELSNHVDACQVYWQSLKHHASLLGDDSAATEGVPKADEAGGTARRQFLKLMGASLGLAGVSMTGCRRWPQEQIVPHNAQPNGTAPGRKQEYASCWELGGVTTGVMVTTVDGRPIKIEGNPQHPYSLGAADAMTQASILEMYDPERSRRITENVKGNTSERELVPRNWQQFLKFAHAQFDEIRKNDGRGLAMLSGMGSSPTTLRMAQALGLSFAQSHWYTYEPFNRDHELEGTQSIFGQSVRPVWNFERAKIVACFDANLFGTHPGRQKWIRQWSLQRTGETGQMNRWYVAEPSPTITGSVADDRLATERSRIPLLMEMLATMLGITKYPDGQEPKLSSRESLWLKALHQDLVGARGSSVVVVGNELPPHLHALAIEINQTLGNVGATLTYVEEAAIGQGPCLTDIKALTEAINRGEIQTLVILGGNPVFDAPMEFPLLISPEKPLTTIHLSLYFNETSSQCRWHVPMAHWLESWGDGRAWDGVYSVRQPMILPLFEGKTEAELLANLLRHSTTDGRELVRETCKEQRLLPGVDAEFEKSWEDLLHAGALPSSTFATVNVPTQTNVNSIAIRPRVIQNQQAKHDDSEIFELAVSPDSSVYDGRFANNGWLQELPDPMTKLTWDNAAWISPAKAQALGLKNGDVVRISLSQDESGNCEIPVYLMPGQAPNTIGVAAGYGRWVIGEIGKGIGTDIYPLRKQFTNDGIARVRISKTGKFHPLAATQDHPLTDAVGTWGRNERVGELHQSGSIVREATWEAYSANHDAIKVAEHGPKDLQLFGSPSTYKNPHAWGMSIDLSKCVGCSACVVACQAENNIPIVGKSQVAVSREMHWIRIDRYFKGSTEDPEVIHMPMTCHHCETAPCEQVCPVAATVHDSEGLNSMVYNRCIGTRYCSNNCPAKVRRFNFFDYHSTSPSEVRKPWLGIPDMQQRTDIDALRQMQFNPEVTVRMRGVMEKCTYCTQRIQAAKITARVAHAQGHRDTPLVKDGEVIPACAAACPAAAIQFGDLNDESSQVSKAKADSRTYEFLDELQLRPRTTYMAKLRNPASGLLPDQEPREN